jgi:chemotaxis protein MotA
MNVNSILGFIIASAVLFLGLRLASEDLGMFIDYPSMFIVVGGTFAATAISFQLNRFVSLLKIFIHKMLKGKKYSYKDQIVELMQLADSYRKGESFKQLKEKCSDFFLVEALGLLEDGVLTVEETFEILEQRNGQITYNYMEDANKIKTVGKYPPAFGMIGTTIGMVVLLANLGGEDAMKMIGPAMGVCLITTLYGSIIANMFFLPVGDNLTEGAKEINLKNKIIIEGVKLIVVKSNPIVVAERLNSFLNPGERLDWKEVMGK